MKTRIRRSYSQISHRIYTRYMLSFILLIAILFGGFFLAWQFFSMFVWQKNDPLYYWLKALQNFSPYIILLTILIGFFVLTNIAIKTPLRYLDEVIDATKKLANPSDEKIILPKEMVDIENELNLARQQALQNRYLIKEAEQRKNDLIMYLAHDLKTPLASVIGYLNLLRDEEQISDELREKYLSISLEKAECLEDLINEFFEIARFNLSNITLQYSQINFTRLLEQLIYEFKPMLDEKELTCSLHVKENIMLYCDANKLQRVFDNLLRNAILYSFSKSEITIEANQKEDKLTISFTNHGNTIPRDRLDRIFEQFYRLDASRSSSNGGAGLGLAIAKEIVELHHGEIKAESENEKIAFTVILPTNHPKK